MGEGQRSILGGGVEEGSSLSARSLSNPAGAATIMTEARMMTEASPCSYIRCRPGMVVGAHARLDRERAVEGPNKKQISMCGMHGHIQHGNALLQLTLGCLMLEPTPSQFWTVEEDEGSVA